VSQLTPDQRGSASVKELESSPTKEESTAIVGLLATVTLTPANYQRLQLSRSTKLTKADTTKVCSAKD
jgi:hypothetical protein